MISPELSAELIKLAADDQTEIKNHYQQLKLLSESEQIALNNELQDHCHVRASRMMEILSIIKEPSITNIGQKGSGAVSLLALHSYFDEMKEVLKAYQAVHDKDPGDVYAESIPSLVDRIMIFEERMQLYGNNWMKDKNGNFFLIPVKDFASMNSRRAKFGLGPRMKPTILAIGENKYPLSKGLAEFSDQKELTDQEYKEFTQGYLR